MCVIRVAFRVPCAHRERLRPFLDDKALYEVSKDIGFNHSLRGRRSLALTTDPARHRQHWGGRGGGWGRSSGAWRGGQQGEEGEEGEAVIVLNLKRRATLLSMNCRLLPASIGLVRTADV